MVSKKKRKKNYQNIKFIMTLQKNELNEIINNKLTINEKKGEGGNEKIESVKN